MEDITRAKLADMLDCSVALVKKYEGEFSDWLTTPPGTKGVAVAKVFDEGDVRTLATIHAMRQASLSYDDIRDQLDEALATGRYDVVVEEELLDEDAQPAQDKSERFTADPGAAVATAQQVVVMRSFQALQDQLDALRDQLEGEAQKLEEERQARLDAERRAAAGDATREERDRLLDRLARIEAQLDEERTKSWWDKLRGR